MYDKILKLMEEKGVTAYRVAMDTGISQVSFSDWKNGRSKPSLESLIILSRYFGVTLEELISEDKQ